MFNNQIGIGMCLLGVAHYEHFSIHFDPFSLSDFFGRVGKSLGPFKIPLCHTIEYTVPFLRFPCFDSLNHMCICIDRDIRILLNDCLVREPVISMFMCIEHCNNGFCTYFLNLGKYLFTHIVISARIHNDQTCFPLDDRRVVHKSFIFFVWFNHWSMHYVDILIGLLKFECPVSSQLESFIHSGFFCPQKCQKQRYNTHDPHIPFHYPLLYDASFNNYSQFFLNRL